MKPDDEDQAVAELEALQQECQDFLVQLSREAD